MSKLETAFNSLKQNAPEGYQADIGIIIGSGLNQLIDCFNIVKTINYSQIDGFPQSTAPGHKGRLHIGSHQDKTLAIFEGRFHLYEGWSAKQAAMQVQLCKMMGVRNLIITNAVGALNPELSPGDVMMVTEHINFTGCSPLRGENDDSLGVRFPDMSQAYNPALQTLAESVFADQSISLYKGIYAGVLGPELETSAERRFFRSAGADAIGMSLVMETIAAVHCGIKVLALTAVTNSATGGPDQQPDTIEEVLENAAISATKITQALPSIIEKVELS